MRRLKIKNSIFVLKFNTMPNLTKDELNLIHEIKKDFITKKLALGDLELHKVKILKEVEAIEKVFLQNEKDLANKYGADSIINMETGEVTQKEKQDVKN